VHGQCKARHQVEQTIDPLRGADKHTFGAQFLSLVIATNKSILQTIVPIREHDAGAVVCVDHDVGDHRIASQAAYHGLTTSTALFGAASSRV
jgi:hypothetical protein